MTRSEEAVNAPRILIAYDGSEGARRALERAARFMPHTKVAVVSVAEPVYRQPGLVKFPSTVEQERQRTAITEAQEALRAAGIESHAVLPVGDAADEIVDAAREWGAELIVLGARGLNRFTRLVLGSVSTKVLHKAACDVLVVK